MWKIYGKAIVAFVIAVLTAVASVLTTSHLGADTKIQIATAVATAVGVYLVPAVPQWPWAKTAVAAVLAALNLASTLIVSHHGVLSTADIVNLVIAALGVLVIHTAPAVSLARPTSASGR
jgi:hypothetical protein